MKNYNTIQVKVEKGIGELLLNRPEKHNAIDALMINEIRDAVSFLGKEPDVRTLFISGKGKSFSSGADLNYMRDQASMSVEDNQEDSVQLAKMFYEIYSCPIPVISYSFGNIAGGANGIIAASDYALTLNDSVFRFSEVLLGLVPATISPYVLDRIGRSSAMELLLSGRSFSGDEAQMIGLVNRSAKPGEIDDALEETKQMFLRSAPGAIRKTKKLLLDINPIGDIESLILKTSSIIAEARSSAEGLEGMDSFFNKRKPNWLNADL